MNGPDIIKELTTVLKESGWLDKATEYMREHPERFTNTNSGGLISSISFDVSYQPARLKDVQCAEPILFTTIGSIDTTMNGYNEYDTGSIREYTYTNGKIVTEVFTCR